MYLCIYTQLIPDFSDHFTWIFIVFMGFFSFSSFSPIIITCKADWALKPKTNLTLFFCIVSSSTTLKADIF